MAKQVWRTDDGEVFHTEEAALEWEASQKKINDLAVDLYEQVEAVRYIDDAKEIATFLTSFFTVVRK